MTRRHAFFGLLLVAGLTAWGAARAGTEAQSDPAPRPDLAADYAGNDEETATHRFATNQARHWRHLMVKR